MAGEAVPAQASDSVNISASVTIARAFGTQPIDTTDPNGSAVSRTGFSF